jgi:hypothetical protein
VLYGFAQTAAALVDLTMMDTQRAERFVDPYEIERVVNTALITLDLPVAVHADQEVLPGQPRRRQTQQQFSGTEPASPGLDRPHLRVDRLDDPSPSTNSAPASTPEFGVDGSGAPTCTRL